MAFKWYKFYNITVGILALSTCTNITYSGTYAVLKLVVNYCLEVRGCSKVRLASLASWSHNHVT